MNDKTAFPVSGFSTKGLSRREFFAAMALQGFCANLRGPHNPKVLARCSVEIADALIKELE